MKLFQLQGRDGASKLLGMVQAVPDIWTGAVLDVGCRTGEFQRLLAGSIKETVSYVGVDLQPPASALANLERGLPFPDKTFEVVVALDVLEHTDNIHMAFEELCRVSQKFVLVLLPNAYELATRIRFLRGRPLSGKYGLPLVAPQDRHRWLFGFMEAQAFVHHQAANSRFVLQEERCVVGPRRARVLGVNVCEAWPNLLCQWYMALLKREKHA